jgi:anti-sigma B factor antagonist
VDGPIANRLASAAPAGDGASPPDPLTVERHAVGRRAVLRVSGEVDLSTVDVLRSAVGVALDDGAHELWLDLTPTAFMDSSGLHVLLEAQTRLRELGRRLAIVCPDGVVRKLFEVAGVATALPLYEDLAAANRDA